MSYELKNVSFSYSRKSDDFFHEISYEAKDGRVLAILGPNGAGKTTLMKVSLGLLKKSSGKAFCNGTDFDTLSAVQKASEVSYVPQEVYFPNMTVFNAILLGRRPMMKFGPTHEDLSTVASLIQEFSLQEKSCDNVNALSGGEKQKVTIARALAQGAHVLFFDELTSNLDIHAQMSVMEEIRKVASERNAAVIMILHDINLAIQYCDDFLLMDQGKITAYGKMEELTSEMIDATYHVHSSINEINGQKIVLFRKENEK